jgi:hypothetical protein
MKYWNRVNACSFQRGEPAFQTQVFLGKLVVDVELEEKMGKLAVVDRVPSVDPLTEEDESIRQPSFEYGPFDGSPLLEQIVLRMHAFGDQMPPTLENHDALIPEMDTDVRTVELLLDDQGLVGEEAAGLGFGQVLIVIGPFGTEEVRSSWVLHKVAV